MIKYLYTIVFIATNMIILIYARDTVAPFLIGFILAFILQPAVNYCNLYFSRKISILMVYITTMLIIGMVLFILVPLLYNQIVLLIQKIPLYIEYLQWKSTSLLNIKIPIINITILDKILSITNQLVNNFLYTIKVILNNLWYYTISTINIIFFIILIPISLFFFLKDWQSILKTIKDLIPPSKKLITLQLLREIRIVLSAYIGGQFNICLILALYYALGLYIININFWFLIGIISGFSIIFPFVGILLTFLLTIVVTYIEYGSGIKMLYVIFLFILGHLLEGYFLTPRIIGKKLGLHPLWIFFILMLWVKLFGITGILLAMPSAGILKVLFRFFIQQYKSNF